MAVEYEILLKPTSQARRFRANLIVILAVAATLIALVPLVAVGTYVISQGIGVINLDFFTQDPPGDLSASGGGLEITGSLARRLRALVPLIGPILLGSLIDVRERTFALEARGFGAGGRRTAYRVVPDPPADRWLRLVILVAIVAVVAGRPRPDDGIPMSDAGGAAPGVPHDALVGRNDMRGGPRDVPALAVEALEVQYHGRRTPALAGIDLEVATGEIVGVAGRNGAGKSTLTLAAAAFIPRVVKARLGGSSRSGDERPRGRPSATSSGRSASSSRHRRTSSRDRS